MRTKSAKICSFIKKSRHFRFTMSICIIVFQFISICIIVYQYISICIIVYKYISVGIIVYQYIISHKPGRTIKYKQSRTPAFFANYFCAHKIVLNGRQKILPNPPTRANQSEKHSVSFI